MKVIKGFNIDVDLAVKLEKEPNASKVVNDALIAYYAERTE